MVFTGTFLAELLVRMGVYRLKFFFGSEWKYNMFDLLVVMSSVIDYLGPTGMNLTWLRLVRVLRLLRLLTTFRSVHYFTDLRLLLNVAMLSAKRMMWCVLSYLLICFLCATFSMEMLLTWESDPTDPTTYSFLQEYFSSFHQSISTMVKLLPSMDLFGDFIPDTVEVAFWLRCVCLANVSLTAFCIVPIVYGTYTLRVFDSQKMAPEEATSRCATDNAIFSDELMYRCYKLGYEKPDIVDEDQLDDLLMAPEVEMFLLTHGMKMFACEVLAIASQGDPSASKNLEAGPAGIGSETERLHTGRISIEEFVMLCTYMRQTQTKPSTVVLNDQIDALVVDMVCIKDNMKVLERFRRKLPQLLINMIHFVENQLEANRDFKIERSMSEKHLGNAFDG